MVIFVLKAASTTIEPNLAQVSREVWTGKTLAHASGKGCLQLKRLGIVVLLVMALTPPLDMRSQAGAEALHNNCGGEPGRWVVGYGGTGNYPEMEGAEAVVRTRNGNPCDHG
jgi:hypothetical protein